MNAIEDTLIFAVADTALLGIVHRPESPRDCGVLIIVGGPQYRVGSHRQFLLLARRLAAEGYPVLRFDVRGMGDSDGEMRPFDTLGVDIGAAIDALQPACSMLRRVVLWGLCDAASAALLYAQSSPNPRVAGMVLLNPWVRSEASLAQTHIKHYYRKRLFEGEFWRKLLTGKMQIFAALRGFLRSAMLARGGPAPENELPSFQGRMASGLKRFPGKVLLILSGDDYTAKEFLEYAASNAAWAGLLLGSTLTRMDLAEADHAFSSGAQRSRVEDGTLAWLGELFLGPQRIGARVCRRHDRPMNRAPTSFVAALAR